MPVTCTQAFVDEAFGYFRPGGEVGDPLPLPVQVEEAFGHGMGHFARVYSNEMDTIQAVLPFLITKAFPYS